MKTLLLAILIIGVSVLLLGIRIYFIKGGKFPNTHIDKNKAMQKKNITCVHKDLIK